jgi:hypothetical protein
MRSPEYFRDKAAEARVRASQMRTSEAREVMLQIAAQYDNLLRLAEQEEGRTARQFSAWASLSLTS